VKQPAPGFPVSKGAIDRAGETLRDWWLRPLVDVAVPEEAAEILFAFRAEFQNPMKKMTVGVRQFVARESPAAEPVAVGQRLNWAPQIVEKLGRHPGMKLARMQDIGGCRARAVPSPSCGLRDGCDRAGPDTFRRSDEA